MPGGKATIGHVGERGVLKIRPVRIGSAGARARSIDAASVTVLRLVTSTRGADERTRPAYDNPIAMTATTEVSTSRT